MLPDYVKVIVNQDGHYFRKAQSSIIPNVIKMLFDS